ncbi:Dihydroorotate dehydrogenase (quinone) [wastewater metagenome]|uniref:dihydroorotate dehydrogenase (quinone) n=2 Tax=unclassified sequences TaxID=12908 RepID=A0A5B8RDI1_9ZZZZ|nr:MULTISPECIES: quinone-dependent dihydroorotate dehydrogenase [Arhodomonas]MCS4503241.1 quinone-dependent dihydroorotate dehydrogenase [Arhodomonas aquaeolei]QEA04777.1 dihydroorotate dehydrogenase (quinone) [uncultured organism]
MYRLIRPLLFSLDAERAHELTLAGLDRLHALGLNGLAARPPAGDPVTVMGLRFPNPVGLAAGLDKNGDHVDALGALGFGFVEVGTVTPRPQPGNPRPRLFRLPGDTALINRFGFNNKGVDHLVGRLQARRFEGVVGVNIGKNRDTPLTAAVDDYRHCLERVYAHADYVVVNVSSPNTPGLRELQGGDHLGALLEAVCETRERLTGRHGRRVPLVIKISPDMAAGEVAVMAERVLACGIDGVTATNTTLSRDGLTDSRMAAETGGLSGAPLRDRAGRTLTQLAGALDGRVPLIGVGGITCDDDAAARRRAGAALIQLYTGLIYRGPGLIGECARALRDESLRPSPAET